MKDCLFYDYVLIWNNKMSILFNMVSYIFYESYVLFNVVPSGCVKHNFFVVVTPTTLVLAVPSAVRIPEPVAAGTVL